MTDCVENWVTTFFDPLAKQPPYNISHVKTPGSVNKPAFYTLPDGIDLDPYYAAKVMPLLQPGDMLWAVGRRPHSAACRD
jgi:hypothetical protein